MFCCDSQPAIYPYALTINNFGADALGINLDLLQPPSHLMEVTCSAINQMQPGDKKTLHKNYHDSHYGFPIHDDNELFGRLVLEINQVGLSWEMILKKEKTFRRAYHNFNSCAWPLVHTPF